VEQVSGTFNVDLRRLTVLRELQRRGSLARTAEALHLTPSAVSQQLAALTREMGVPLTEREGRGVRLTAQARVLLTHADVIAAQLERARADLAAYGEGGRGSVTVGCFSSGILGLLPGAMNALADRLPQVRIDVVEAEPPDVFTALDSGQVDLAVAVDFVAAQRPERLVETRESLPYAPRVVERNTRHPQPGHREGHDDAVVAVGLDLRARDGSCPRHVTRPDLDPVGPVATSTPNRRRPSAQASSRSHSFTRVLPTSSMRTGPEAKGAIAASVGMVSEMSRMLTVRPRNSPVPRTRVPCAPVSTSAPMRRSTSTKPRSPWSAPVPSPGTVTSPPVTAAAAKK
jgi:DNA-binding transcriptional LysR family regulator